MKNYIMEPPPVLQIFLASLLAIPLVWALDKTTAMGDQRLIFVAGVITLSTFAFIAYIIIRGTPNKREPLFYAWSVFAFTACVDLLIGLELDGYISGFMRFYLQQGEPYLQTAHGALINWWDGTGHYSMYLILLHLCCSRQEYNDFGLYWVGSISNSMVPLLLGGATGTFKVKWSYFLNIPYVVMPLYAGVRFLSERRAARNQRSLTVQPAESLHILRRPVDLLFVLYLVLALCFTLFRGLVILGCEAELTRSYLNNVEPYLKHPDMFSHIQMLTFLFYFSPYYVAAIYGLLFPGQGWMIDWSYLFAGASAQGQIVHILASVHNLTESKYHVPSSQTSQLTFWVANLALLVIPQLFALRCHHNPEFFFSKALKISEVGTEQSTSPRKSLLARRPVSPVTGVMSSVTSTSTVEKRVTRSRNKKN